MFLNSGLSYYNVVLNNRIIYTEKGLQIKNPSFKIRLLTYAEYAKIDIMRKANVPPSDIYEDIFTACYLGILGFEDETLNAEETGLLIDTLGALIFKESSKYFTNPEYHFNTASNDISKFDIWCGFIARILNLNYDDVKQKPIDEIIRLYSLSFIVSGGTIPHIDLKPKQGE